VRTRNVWVDVFSVAQAAQLLEVPVLCGESETRDKPGSGKLRTRRAVTWMLFPDLRIEPPHSFKKILKTTTSAVGSLSPIFLSHPRWAWGCFHQPFQSSAMMPTLERHRASHSTHSATHDVHLTPCSLGYLPPATSLWFTRNFLASA
jgi:hypothetical protein